MGYVAHMGEMRNACKISSMGRVCGCVLTWFRIGSSGKLFQTQ